MSISSSLFLKNISKTQKKIIETKDDTGKLIIAVKQKFQAYNDQI